MGRKISFDNRTPSGETGEGPEKSLIKALRAAVDAQQHQRQIKDSDLIEVQHGRMRVRILGSLATGGLVAVLCLDLLLRAWHPGYVSPTWMPGTLLILALTSLILAWKM